MFDMRMVRRYTSASNFLMWFNGILAMMALGISISVLLGSPLPKLGVPHISIGTLGTWGWGPVTVVLLGLFFCTNWLTVQYLRGAYPHRRDYDNRIDALSRTNPTIVICGPRPEHPGILDLAQAVRDALLKYGVKLYRHDRWLTAERFSADLIAGDHHCALVLQQVPENNDIVYYLADKSGDSVLTEPWHRHCYNLDIERYEESRRGGIRRAGRDIVRNIIESAKLGLLFQTTGRAVVRR